MRRKIERHLKNIALNLFNNIKNVFVDAVTFFYQFYQFYLHNTKCVVFTTRELRSVLSYLKRKA